MTYRRTQVEYVCDNCAIPFVRGIDNRPKHRFCCFNCRSEWREKNNITAGQFKPGNTSAMKGRKGVHLSPKTEFKKGQLPTNRVPIGTVRIRHRNRDGKSRAWIKVAEPNCWQLRAVLNWEKAHGPLPAGHIVHHRDRDTLNDNIDNLEAVTRAAHMIEHRPEFESKRVENRRKVDARRNSGIGTVPMRALKLGRKAIGIELNPTYYADAVAYCRAAEQDLATPSLFDLINDPADDAIPEPEESAA